MYLLVKAAQDATAALLAFAIESTIATGGLNLVLAALIVGIGELVINWDRDTKAVSTYFKDMGDAMQIVGADIQYMLANLETALGNFLKHVPGLGGVADAAIEDAQGRIDAASHSVASNPRIKGHVTDPTFSLGGSDNPLAPTDPFAVKDLFGNPIAPSAPAKTPPYVPPTHPSTANITGTSTGKSPAAASSEIQPKADLIDKGDTQAALIKDRQEAFEHAYQIMDASLDPYIAKVKSATTEQAKLDAQQVLSAKTAKELSDKQLLISEAIKVGSASSVQLQAEYTRDLGVTNSLADRHNALAKSINAEREARVPNKAEIAAQRIELERLNTDYAEAKKKSDAEYSAITANNSALERQIALRVATRKAAAEQANAFATLQQKYDEATSKMKEANAEFTATQGMSTKQLFDYYASLYEDDEAKYESYLNVNLGEATKYEQLTVEAHQKMMAEIQKMRTEDVEAEKKAAADKVAAAQKVYDQEQSMLDKLFTDIDSRKSLQDTLKDLTTELNKDNSKALSKMILGTSPDDAVKKADAEKARQAVIDNTAAIKRLTDELGSQASTPSGTTQASSDGALHGTDNLFHSGGASQITPLQTNTTQIAGSNLSVSSGSTGSQVASIANGTAVSSSFDSSAPNWDPASAYTAWKTIGSSSTSVNSNWSDAEAYAGTYGQDTSPSASMQGSNTTGPSSPLGGGAGGASVGAQDTSNYISGGLELYQGLFNKGHNGAGGGTFSQTLGGAAEIAGTAIGGPVVGQAAGEIGTLIGSMFGPHDLNPAQQPDIYNEIPTVQAEGELSGSGAALGLQGQQTFDPLLDPVIRQLSKAYGTNPQSSTASQLAGSQSPVTEIGFIQRWVSQNQNSADPATAALVADVQSKFGDQATDPTGTMVGGKYGNFTVPGGSVSGKATDIQTVAQQVLAAIGAAGSTSPIFSVSHTAPDFQQGKIAQWGTGSNGIFTQDPTSTTTTGTTGTRTTSATTTAAVVGGTATSATAVQAAQAASAAVAAASSGTGNSALGTIVSLSADTIKKLTGSATGAAGTTATATGEAAGKNPTGTIIGGIAGALLPGVGGLVGGLIGSLFGHHHNNAPTTPKVTYPTIGAGGSGGGNVVNNTFNVTLPNAVLMGSTIAQVAATISQAISKNAQLNAANTGYA